MGEFLHKYNTDNVHSRAVIVGMVNLLNSKVLFENVLSDTSTDTVYVPFYYNMGGDERFLQDYFLEWNDCIHPRHADGNYDVIPRGIVTMTSKTIDTAKMTHRFVRGTYVKEVNGELQQFNSFINSLPIAMNFDVEIEVDSNLDAFKVEQAIMETFYKVQVFSVNFRGFRIPCQIGFAEDYAVEKTFEFSYQANTRILVKFSLAVETYYPVLDSTSTRSNSNRMNSGIGNGGGPSINESFPETYSKPRFSFEQPTAQEKYFSSGALPIAWSNTGPILRVNLYYRISGAQDWIPIAKNINNTGYYNWEIPFFNIQGEEIPFEPQRASVITKTGRGSKVRPIINALGEVDQIVIFESGFAYSNTDMIGVSLFPPPGNPALVEAEIQADVVGGSVTGATILLQGSGYVSTPLTFIELMIEDANSPVTYQDLITSITFTGDIDNTLPVPNNSLITNINPTVQTLLQQSPLIGLEIEGAGIAAGSQITSANPVTNTIGINNPVTSQVFGGTLNTSDVIGKILIQ